MRWIISIRCDNNNVAVYNRAYHFPFRLSSVHTLSSTMIRLLWISDTKKGGMRVTGCANETMARAWLRSVKGEVMAQGPLNNEWFSLLVSLRQSPLTPLVLRSITNILSTVQKRSSLTEGPSRLGDSPATGGGEGPRGTPEDRTRDTEVPLFSDDSKGRNEQRDPWVRPAPWITSFAFHALTIPVLAHDPRCRAPLFQSRRLPKQGRL